MERRVFLDKDKKVLVGLSGGIDSLVAAYLLLKQGYHVIGLAIELDNLENSFLCRQVKKAGDFARKLKIPFYTIKLKQEFEDKVINYFCREYKRGRTPNPCVVCNQRIKFAALFKKAKDLGADYFATGHYAKKEYDKINKKYLLKKAKDKEKDQSYFLFFLSQKQLKYCLFPLFDYSRFEVEKKASELGINISEEHSSQDICFIPDRNYRAFLETRLTIDDFKPGLIINKQGEILGKHQGLVSYTIGQRKGIGAHKKPFYVIAIDQRKNRIVVGEKKEIYQNILFVEKINWIKKLGKPTDLQVKIRYRQKPAWANVFPLKLNRARIKFNKSQPAITPGQTAVFYDGDMVIGGGIILHTLSVA